MQQIVLALCIAAATSSALVFSYRLKWSRDAERVGIPFAFGFALAPFLLGLTTIGLLAAFPHYSSVTHFYVAAAFSGLITLLGICTPSRTRFASRTQYFGLISTTILVTISFGTLAFFSITSPWMANDALEYAIVARELLHDNSITTYPVIAAEVSYSGFFGPMTHPPLYPSLLYLFQASSNSDTIGWTAKLVPLWFFIGTCALVYSVGRLYDELTGALSVLLLMSVPFLRDSIATGLIDALPMAGLMLFFSSQVGLVGSPRYRGVVSGVILGAALWTHSQAVLFVPLFPVLAAINSRFNIKGTIVESSVGLLVASLIAAPPYLRNLLLFGSPVSDAPEVFSLPSLNWPEYFEQARGLTTATAKLQYGLLKGWFSFGSFGVFFWTALPGVAVTAFAAARTFTRQEFETPQSQLSSNAIAIFAFYYAGVTASLVLGIDLLIRNDRYLLAWIAPFAIIGGIGLSAAIHRSWELLRDSSKSIPQRETIGVLTAGLFMFGIAIPTMLLSAAQLYQALLPLRTGSRFYDRLDQINNIHLAMDIDKVTPKDAVILSIRPSDIYYSHRRMVSYLDPRLKAFYQADTAESAAHELRALGITHVQQPDYSMPPSYRTHLRDILSDPDQSTLTLDYSANQLYTLGSSRRTIGRVIDLTNPQAKWEHLSSIPIIGSSHLRIDAKRSPYVVGTPSITALPFGMFQNDYSAVLHSTQRMNLEKEAEYRLDLDISGAGFVRISVRFCSTTLRLNELALDRPHTRTTVRRRFISPTDADNVELIVEHVGSSNLTLHAAHLIKIDESRDIQ